MTLLYRSVNGYLSINPASTPKFRRLRTFDRMGGYREMFA